LSSERLVIIVDYKMFIPSFLETKKPTITLSKRKAIGKLFYDGNRKKLYFKIKIHVFTTQNMWKIHLMPEFFQSNLP
jgi:hypothetical protein